MNRYLMARRLRVRANRLDRIAWGLEKLALARGSDPDLQDVVAEQRKLAEQIRQDANIVRPRRKSAHA